MKQTIIEGVPVGVGRHPQTNNMQIVVQVSQEEVIVIPLDGKSAKVIGQALLAPSVIAVGGVLNDHHDNH